MKNCILCHRPYQKGASGPSSIFKKIVEICKENLLSDLTKDWLSSWDFGKQNQFPFCIGCFKSAQNLTELQEELFRIQKGFLNSVVIFTLGIVESRKKNKLYNKKESRRNNQISGGTNEEIMEYSEDEFPIDIKEEHFLEDWGDDLENDPLGVNVLDNSDVEELATKTTNSSQRHKTIKAMSGKNVQKNPRVVLERLQMKPAKCKTTASFCSKKTPEAKIKHSEGMQNKSAVQSATGVEEVSPAIVVDCFSDFDSNSAFDTTELDDTISNTTELEVDGTFEEPKMTSGSQNIEKTETDLGQFPAIQKYAKVERVYKTNGRSYKLFKCDIVNCDFATKKTCNFEVHLQRKHGLGETKIFMCHQCKKSFSISQSLRSHNIRKHGYKVGPPRKKSASVCSEETPEAKIKHSQGKKSKSTEQSATHVEEMSPAIVVDCFSDFDSNSVSASDTTELEGDATFEQRKMSSGSQNIEKTEKEDKVFPTVQKSVNTKRFRNTDDSTIFKCDVENCDYTSRSKYNFKVHYQMRHGEPKIFPCLQCKKSFNMAQSLRSHNVKFHGYKVGPPRRKRTE